MKQILFISGNTLLLLEYRNSSTYIEYNISYNVKFDLDNEKWYGTCIFNELTKYLPSRIQQLIKE